MSFEHGDELSEAFFGQEVCTSLELCWVDGEGIATAIEKDSFYGPFPAREPDGTDGDIFIGRSLDLEDSDFAAAAKNSNGKYEPSSHRRYRFVATLEKAYPEDLSTVHAKNMAKVAAQVSRAFFSFLPCPRPHPFACRRSPPRASSARRSPILPKRPCRRRRALDQVGCFAQVVAVV